MNLLWKIQQKIPVAVIVAFLLAAVIRTENGAAYCAGIALPVLVYGIFLAAWKACGGPAFFQKLRRKELCLFFGIAVLYMICIFAVTVREDFIYYWDYGSYWYMTVEAGKTLFSNPVKALAQLYVSCNTQEYNLFLAWIMIVPLKLAGNSYLAFVLLTAGMFLIPALALLAVLICKIQQKYGMESLSLIQVWLIVLSITVPLFPVLSGYIDSAALLPLLLCYLLAVNTEYAKKIDWKKSIYAGILLVMLLLMRRYFGFAVVGFVCFFICYAVFGEGIAEWKSGFTYKIGNLAVTGVTSAALLLFFFRGFLAQSLFHHYQDAYAAYQMQTFADKCKSFCLYYGIAVMVLAACPIVFAWKNREKYISMPLVLSLAVSILLFYRIQDFGEHHYYITVVPVIALAVLGYGLLQDLVKRRCRILGVVLTAGVTGVCALNFGCSLGMLERPQNSALFIQRTYTPKIRYDRASLLLLDQELERLDARGRHGVYVVASSGILNEDILRKLNAPAFDKDYELCTVSHVDLRDGFDTGFFDADVVVVCDPLQVHLAAEDQCVISLLQALFTGNADGQFVRNYARTASYRLDDEVTAHVYVKQQELEASDVLYVKELFEERYHEYPQLFGERFDAYIRDSF